MADDFTRIELSVKVDDSPRSIGDINAQIEALSKKLNPLKVKLEIEDGNKLDEITKRLQASLQQIQSVGGQTGKVFTGVASATGTAFNNVSGQVKAVADDLKKSIRQVEDAAGRLRSSSHYKFVPDANGDMQRVLKYNETVESFSNIVTRTRTDIGGKELSQDIINNGKSVELKRQIQDMRDAAKEQIRLIKEEEKARRQLEKALNEELKIRLKLEAIAEKDRKRLEKDAEKIFSNQTKKDLDEAKQVLQEQTRIKSLGDNIGKFGGFSDSAVANINKIKQSLLEMYGPNAKISVIRTMQGDKEVYKYAAAVEQAKGIVNEYRGSVDRATESIYQNGEVVKNNLSRNLSFMDRMKVAMQNIPVWISGMTLIYGTFRSLQSGVRHVVELDTAMVALRKVTDETRTSYREFAVEAAIIGKQLKTSASEVIKATAEFARLGYNMNEAKVMSKEALLYSSVGDVDAATASADMVSIIKGFKIQLDAEGRSIRNIVDSLNEVGNNYAVTVEGLGSALRRSAASLSEAGNTYQEAIALITGANTVIQDPDVVGSLENTKIVFCAA